MHVLRVMNEYFEKMKKQTFCVVNDVIRKPETRCVFSMQGSTTSDVVDGSPERPCFVSFFDFFRLEYVNPTMISFSKAGVAHSGTTESKCEMNSFVQLSSLTLTTRK